MGFVLPENFLYPYAAVGFSDFWRRWHITLSAWLRDYLYIPLGGNRNGKFKTYINLMITMLLGGLWHGANWTFVVWGALHGFYLWVEKFIQDHRMRVKATARTCSKKRICCTGINGTPLFKKSAVVKLSFSASYIFLVNVTWVFFRAPDFTSAWRMLTSMFSTCTQRRCTVIYPNYYKNISYCSWYGCLSLVDAKYTSIKCGQ
ncbi:MAG: MBOAT family O-acyltransferase [Chitinophagaceae bacterium]